MHACTRLCLAYRVSRDDGNLACRVSLTRHAIYISACARARCRACPPAYLCVSHEVQRDNDGERWRGGGKPEHGTRRLLSPCILAHYSGRAPPTLIPKFPLPCCPECHVVWLRPCLVLSRRSISAPITRALHSCVRACIWAELYEKSHFAYLCPLRARLAMPISSVAKCLLKKFHIERDIVRRIRRSLFREYERFLKIV